MKICLVYNTDNNEHRRVLVPEDLAKYYENIASDLAKRLKWKAWDCKIV